MDGKAPALRAKIWFLLYRFGFYPTNSSPHSFKVITQQQQATKSRGEGCEGVSCAKTITDTDTDIKSG